MDYVRPGNSNNLLSLQDAALKLGVSVEVLLKWNDYHILKPTITQTGEIGYTQQQITEFQTIRQLLQTTSPSQAEQMMSEIRHDSAVSQELQQAQQSSDLPATPKSIKLLSPLLIAGSIGVVVLVLTFFIMQGQLQSFISASTSGVVGSQNGATFTGPLSSMHFSDTTEQNRNLHADSGSVFGQKVSTVLNEKHLARAVTPTPLPSRQTQAQKAVAKAPSQPAQEVAAANDSDIQQFMAHDTLPLSSVSHPAAKPSDATFDNNGNLTDEPSKNAIASVIGGGNFVVGSNEYEQTNTQLRNQFIVLLMGSLGFVLLYLRKPKKSAPAAATISTLSDKVLELDQKMDGTVVLTFQGNTYKISKPELYSDSDRFIERLMELIQPGMKEVEYDSWTDEKTRLSAPLSRLVTRLGFVGIKRDLFFPRTSKNRVLFRKYITQKDLDAMNITVHQLSKQLFETA